MRTQILITLAGFFIWGFAHAAVQSCTAETVGQMSADRAVKIGQVTTYFNPGLCLGEKDVARVLDDENTSESSVCLALGHNGGGTIGDEARGAHAGSYGVTFNSEGEVNQVTTICANETCPRVIQTISCRTNPNPNP